MIEKKLYYKNINSILNVYIFKKKKNLPIEVLLIQKI